jgi:hypothetical protein
MTAFGNIYGLSLLILFNWFLFNPKQKSTSKLDEIISKFENVNQTTDEKNKCYPQPF